MRVIATSTLREFWAKHPDAQPSLRTWVDLAEGATWASTTDIKAMFASASFVANDRVVFNIAGNKYRLIVSVKYATGIVYVCFVGTHKEYDAVDAATVRNY